MNQMLQMQNKQRSVKEIKFNNGLWSHGKLNGQLIAYLEAMPDFVSFVDAEDNRLLFLNRAGRAMTGVAEDEDVTLLKFKDIHPVWASTMIDEIILPTAICNEFWQGEFAIQHRNGQEIPVSMVLAAHKVESGMIDVFSTTSRNITQLKQTEALLRQSSSELDDLYNNAACGFHSLDKEGVICRINDTELAWLGYTRDELLGKVKFTDLLTPSSAQDFKVNYPYLQNDGAICNIEGELVRKDGTIMVALINATAVYDSKGEYQKSRTTLTDITERKQSDVARLNTARMRQLMFENSHYAMMMLAPPSWKFTAANLATLELFEVSSEAEFTRLGPWNISPEYQLDGSLSSQKASEMIAIAMSEGSHYFEWEHQTIAGQPFAADVLLSRIDVGSDVFLQATVRDISKRKRVESELRIAVTVFDSQQGMLITDVNDMILRVNKTFVEITGYTESDVAGQTTCMLRSDRHDAMFYADLWQDINNTGSWQGEIWGRRKNGEIYPEHLTISTVKDKNGLLTNYVYTFNDITKSKLAENEINQLVFYDSLTHLPNRRLLIDRLQQVIVSNAHSGLSSALLFIDIDNFKMLNDTLGYNMGDLLIHQVAQRLESCVRKCDTVARLGGDEFMVMLRYLSKNSLEAATQTESVGNKILSSLNLPYQLDTNEYLSSSSIGVTVFGGKEHAHEELLKQVDIALYQAKNSGRNRLCFFDPLMQESISARVSMENELRKAIDKQEFELYYQAQVDDSSCIIGAEALIRWNHPERGQISPAEFIPLAEDTGLILEIGQWVLNTACLQLKLWQQNMYTRNLFLAVNVSAKQFRQPDFIFQVQALVLQHDINPIYLKLELTESLLLDDIQDAVDIMKGLKIIGVKLSLDDFGTGYSSLQYLKRLPLDQLKIDQSFLRDIATDRDDKAIVRTIVAMAQSLNLGVIAEGVETKEQRQILLEMNCTHYQGYLFSKPIPVSHFDKFLNYA